MEQKGSSSLASISKIYHLTITSFESNQMRTFFQHCASKMTPLETHKRIYKMMSVYPLDKDSSKWKTLACIIFVLFISISEITCFVASASFVMKFVSTDLEQSLHALFQFIYYTCATFYTLHSVISRRKFRLVFDKLTEIYRKCKNKFE